MADTEVECVVEEERKRPRDEGEGGHDVPVDENVEKKQCASFEAAAPAAEGESMEAVEEVKDGNILAEAEGEKEEKSASAGGDGNLKEVSAVPSEAKVGPKVFSSSTDMFNYFYDLVHAWPLNFNVNKYEHLMLEDLILKGHQEPQKKVGTGIEAFQVRVNPEFYSRCYYIIRKDGSVEDFSYRKCVDNVMPLPEDIKSRSGDLRVGNKRKGHEYEHDRRGRGGRGRGGGGRGGRRGGGGGHHGRGNRGRGGRF